MNYKEPWDTRKRFAPDESLLDTASMAKALAGTHNLDNSKLNTGLQEFVDAVGEQAYAAAEVVRANTEGEKLKAGDRRALNEVEHEDRKSLIEDIKIHSALSHVIREQVNRGLYNEGKTLELANQSHELANSVVENALELQALKTQEQIDNIRSEINQKTQKNKNESLGGVKDQLSSLRNRRAITYNKAVGGDGQMVDARLGTPSAMVESLEES